MKWDLFCRVIDNHGDVGVCWRLASDLAMRGQEVRLWIDDPAALSWMAPKGSDGVEIADWLAPSSSDIELPAHAQLGDVVVEAFGCDLPSPFVRRMATRPRPPVWINLEYLSAEGFVERAHKLASPQTTGPAAGLRKWFFYPGFTAQTGGLIREPDLLARQEAFDRVAWLSQHSDSGVAGERVVSLFCYEQPLLASMLKQLARVPTLLLATNGHAARQTAELLGPKLQLGALRAVLLAPLTQLDYDHLLWASDLNMVRGEDSFVRAQWAGKPFLWQIYPQTDGAHVAKLDAFLDRYLPGPYTMDRSLAMADGSLGASVRRSWRAWNALDQEASGVTPGAPGAACELPPLPAAAAWMKHCSAWRQSLLSLPDLSTQLLRFVAETG